MKDLRFIPQIEYEVNLANQDNISRTKAYEQFYRNHPEIKWSFLAGMVSRNAGWNMCDLTIHPYCLLMKAEYRRQLFLTYEQANWLIFRDAYPQLLLYHYSTKENRSLFHLSRYFFISVFMEREWERFWVHHDETRLAYSQIINEQSLIQEPVIEKGPHTKPVFHSLLFRLQDLLHFSTVIFPARSGELFGDSVSDFRSMKARIELGKRLFCLLFSKGLYREFHEFALTSEHTGSRQDYLRYSRRDSVTSPPLRALYPVIRHSFMPAPRSQSRLYGPEKWYTPLKSMPRLPLNDFYRKKQEQLEAAAALKSLFTIKKHFPWF